MSLGEIGPKIPGFNNAGSSFGKSYYTRSDAGRFEKRLSINGAVGDGVTDDAAAIQKSIYDCYSVTQGRLAKLIFPPGLTWYFNTCVGSTARTNYVGAVVLDIPATLGIDWNYGVLNFGSTAGTATGFLFIHADPLYVNSQDYGLARTFYENFTINANQYFSRGAMFLDDIATGGVKGPARVGFSRIFFNNCQVAIGFHNNTYANYVYRCEFSGGSSTSVQVLLPAGLANAGESYSFDGCMFYNGATAVQAYYSDWNFVNCNFDYNTGPNGVFNLQSSSARVSVVNSHIEFSRFAGAYSSSGTSAQVTMNGSSYSIFNLIGSSIVVAFNSGGNQLGSFADSGTTQNTSNAGYPCYGIVLDRPYISYGSGGTFAQLPLNRTTATGRFVYIP